MAFDRLRVGVAAAGFVTFVNLYAPQALLPTLATEFGLRPADSGLSITATLVAVALVAPFVGAISDALGRRWLIVSAAFGMVAPALLLVWSPSFVMLLAGRFAQGLLLPFIFAVTVAYIADERPGPAGVRTTASYVVGTIVGGFSGRFITGWTAELLDWRMAFLVLAALTLMCAATVALMLPREQNFVPNRTWRGTLAGFGDHFRNPQVVVTCGIGFAVLFSIVATFTYANFLLAAPPFLLGPAALGSVFVVYLMGAVAAPISARLTIAIGRTRTLLLAGAIGAAGLVLTLAPALPLILAGLGVVAAGIFCEQALTIGHVAVSARRARSSAVGLYVTCYYVGGALGGIAPAWVWAHAGWPGCVALVLGVQAVALTTAARVWPASPPVTDG